LDLNALVFYLFSLNFNVPLYDTVFQKLLAG